MKAWQQVVLKYINRCNLNRGTVFIAHYRSQARGGDTRILLWYEEMVRGDGRGDDVEVKEDETLRRVRGTSTKG